MRLFFIALLATVTLASCGKMKQPELLGIENLKIKDIGAGEVTLYVKFFNPNSFKATLKHADGELWLDSSYLGRFVVDDVVKAAAKSEFVVPVNLTMDLKDFALQSLTLFNKKEVLIKVEGKLRAGRSGFYKNIPLHYEGKQDLEKLLKSK